MTGSNYKLPPEIIAEFADESSELLEEASILAVRLEKEPKDGDLVNRIFRIVHSIKGNAAYFGMFKGKDLAHRLEETMKSLRDDGGLVSSSCVQLLLSGFSILRGILANIRAGRDEFDDPAVMAGFMAAAAAYEQEKAAGKGIVSIGSLREKLSLLSDVAKSIHDGNGEFSGGPKDLLLMEGLIEEIKNELCALEPGISSVVTDSAADSAVVDSIATVSQVSAEEARPAGAAERRTGHDEAIGKTMRVPEAAVDAFLDFVGELVIVGEMYESIEKKLCGEIGSTVPVRELTRNNKSFDKLSQALQKSILDIRKVPLGNLFRRAEHLVRDACTVAGRKASVIVSGGGVSVDKSQYENLEGPLAHLVRNSVDHGIEPAHARREMGKQEEGVISLSAREEENSIVISISDDGGGIDTEKVRSKAVANGLISEEKARFLDDEAVHDFIFAPGFSTAAAVTQISGRGVGMDVVRRNIEAIGGKTEIVSDPGKGTEVRIRIPKSVTIRIIQGFLISVRGVRIILPAASVGESFRISDEMITSVAGKGRCVTHHGRVLPVLDLAELLFPGSAGHRDSEAIGVVYDPGNNPRILLIEAVLGIQQVVVKDILGLPSGADLIAGGAIIGDGRLAIVLDTNRL